MEGVIRSKPPCKKNGQKPPSHKPPVKKTPRTKAPLNKMPPIQKKNENNVTRQIQPRMNDPWYVMIERKIGFYHILDASSINTLGIIWNI